MVEKEIILKSLDDAIRKCGRVSTRESIGVAFKRVADKYGLTLEKHDVPREKYDTERFHYNPVYTLYDKEHNTKIVFTENFLDDNTIAFNKRGNHKNHSISIDEVIEGYLRLPNNNKDRVNQIVFKSWGKVKEKDKSAFAYSEFEDASAKEMNTISILSQYFKNKNPTGDDWDNYDYVLAHESTHCLDFRWVSDEEYAVRQKYMNIKSYPTGKDKIIEDHNNLRKKETELNDNYPSYANQKYLEDTGFDAVSNMPFQLNRASDYGKVSDTEDFAETGAMIINGFHNPDNPKAVVRWNGETMQYREWIKLHPYKAQYLVKQVFDEDVSIDYLVGQSINTERNKLPNDDY